MSGISRTPVRTFLLSLYVRPRIGTSYFSALAESPETGNIVSPKLYRFAARTNAVLWDGLSKETSNIGRMKHSDFMNETDVVQAFLKSILTYGIALVDGVPATSEATRTVMERLGPIWPTFWGEIYHVVADLTQFSHPSYTGENLRLHTDTNYYYEGAGLQAFHVLEHTGDGGKNRFVDGYHIAKTIWEQNPQIYQYLSNTLVSFKYREPEKQLDIRNEDFLFRHDPRTSEFVQLRFTPYDFDIFRTIPQSQVLEFYEALSVLMAEIDNPYNSLWLQLKPGTVLVTDNWRILHGRSAFTGRRTLCGMYISRSDYFSKARILNLL